MIYWYVYFVSFTQSASGRGRRRRGGSFLDDDDDDLMKFVLQRKCGRPTSQWVGPWIRCSKSECLYFVLVWLVIPLYLVNKCLHSLSMLYNVCNFISKRRGRPPSNMTTISIPERTLAPNTPLPITEDTMLFLSDDEEIPHLYEVTVKWKAFFVNVRSFYKWHKFWAVRR